MLVSIVSAGGAAAQDVVPDGLTNTTVTVNGLVSDVRTGTLSGGIGINSLRALNASAGRTVNVHVPTGADTTLNIVRDRASRIDGTLNSVMDGQIGGTMIIANPNGVIVGAGGRVNAGSLSVTTPSEAFIDGIIGPDGVVDAASRDALIAGTAPLADADIAIDGQVSVAAQARLQAGRDVLIGGTTAVDARAALVGAFANTGGSSVLIDAGRDVVIGGQVAARSGDAGGAITVRAGRDVSVSGAVDARGDSGADAGQIDILAQRDATISAGGSVLATATGTGAGGDVHFSGLRAVTVIGQVSAAAQGSGALGSLHIDPRELILSEDQNFAGQDTVLEASGAIYVRDVTISTQNLYDAAQIDEYAPTLIGASGDLTLRAPIIDFAEGARIRAEGGRGVGLATFHNGGAVLIEAVADQVLDSAGIAQAHAGITIGNQVQITGGSVTIRAQATAGFDITSVAQVDAFANLSDADSVTDIINDAAAYLTGELAAVGATVLPAVATASANITSNAAEIRADLGDVTIEALATTDINITPEANILSVIGVRSETEATVSLGSSVNNNYDYGFSNILPQRIGASGDVTIRAITQETQNLTARAEGMVATAAIVSDRHSAARVTLDPAFGLSGEMEPWVEFDNGAQVLAQARHDLDFDAVAANGDAAGVALAGIVSLSDSEAIAAGAFRTGAHLDVTAENLWSRYHADAQAHSGDAADLTGAAQAEDASADAQDDLRSGAAASEELSEQNGDSAGDVASGANITAGFVLTLHDDTTAAGLGGVELGGPDYATHGISGFGVSNVNDFSGQGSPITLTARTLLEDVAVTALADAQSAVGVMVAGSLTEWGIETLAQVSDQSIETQGTITVTAQTLFGGADQDSRLDPVLDSIGASTGGVQAGDVLPDAATLLTDGRSSFAANTSGTGSALSATAAAAVTRLDLDTRADIAPGAVLKGPFNYGDYGGDYGGGYGDGYGYGLEAIQQLSLTARTGGTVVTQANDPSALTDGAAVGIGAGVAVSDVHSVVSARNDGSVTSYGTTVMAGQGMQIATLAGSGAGGGVVDLAGAFALSRYSAQTAASALPSIGQVRFDPDMPVADRPAAALRINAQDGTDLITIAGARTGAAAVGVGAAAAINILDRDTRAALGSVYDLDYRQYPYYANSSPLFERGFYESLYSDGLQLGAQTSGGVIAAASAGQRPDGAAGGDTRIAPATLGGVTLNGLEEDSVQTAEEDNPTEGARGGFTLSGAYAGTQGRSETTAYLGHDGFSVLDGALSVTAQDSAQVLTLTGAVVPGDTTVGLAGGFAHSALDRAVRTDLTGGYWQADGISARALLTGRDVTIGGGAAGAGGGAVNLAGAFALGTGSRLAMLDMGAITLDAAGQAMVLEAADRGVVNTIAGAAEGAAAGDGAVGIGAAVALDRSTAVARVETRDYLPLPVEYAVVPQGAVTLQGGSVSILADQAVTRNVTARSTGYASGVAVSGSAAIRTGATAAGMMLDADMTLPDGATILAGANGDSTVHAGSVAGDGAVGLGVSFALQAEERSSEITLGALEIGTSAQAAGALGISALTAGDLSAKATAGALSAEQQQEREDAAEAEGEEGLFAFNGAVAMVTASDDARITAAQEGFAQTRITADAAVLNAVQGANLIAAGGGVTQAGGGIGAGLGVGLVNGSVSAQIALQSLRIDTTGMLSLNARTAGQVRADAVNGVSQGFVNVGVNVAGGATQANARILFGDLSAQPDDGDRLRGGNVALLAEVATGHHADASSLQPSGEDGTAAVVVGLAGYAVQADSEITLGGGDIQSTGAMAITARTQPTVAATSLGADNLRLDFATNEGEDESGFNLGLAAALSDLDLGATVTVNTTDIVATGALTGLAQADVTSATAGRVTTRADMVVGAGSRVLGGSLDLDATARSGVKVDGTAGQTNYGTEARSDAQGNADMVGDAGDAARGDEAEQTAFSVSISPESAQSGAALRVDGAIVGAGTGNAALNSGATTDIILGATDAPLSATIAISEVTADTIITDSAIGASGDLTIGADAVESHRLTARVGAGDVSAIDAAAVVSVRRSRAVVLVDNAAANTGLFGDDIDVDARTTRTLQFDADAVAGDDTFLAMAGNVGFGTGVTSAAIGGLVANSDGSAAGTLDVDATATTSLSVLTRAAGGRTTAAAEDGDDGTGDAGVGAQLVDLGDDVNEDADTSGEGQEGKIADAARLAGAVTVLRQRDVTTATLGGQGYDATGTLSTIAAADITAGTVNLTARNAVSAMQIRTNAFLGEREAGDPNGVGISAAVGYLALDFDTQAVLAEGSQIVGNADIAAIVQLDPQANADRAADLRAVGADAQVEDSFEVTPANAAPTLNTDIAAGDWSISQGAAAAGEDVSIGIDAGILNVDLTTVARIDGAVAGDASAAAQALRGLSHEVGRATYLAGQDGAGVGIGGAVAITAWDELTRAEITRTAAITGTATAQADSAVRRATLATSKGAATSVGVNGALAILSSDRAVQAVVDPRADLTGDVVVRATDSSQTVTSALAQSIGDGVTIGASAALSLEDSAVQAVFGTLTRDGVAGTASFDAMITGLEIQASDAAIRMTSAASGTGREADDGSADQDDKWQVGSVLGTDLEAEDEDALTGTTEDVGGAGESDYGLGISGAFALDLGDSQVQALSLATGGAAAGTVAINALASGLATTATGALVRGADTNGIAGAASINLRDMDIRADLTAMDGSGTDAITVASDARGTVRALAAGQQGASDATFRVAGSVALNLGQTDAVTSLHRGDITGARDLRVTSQVGGEITTLAGVRQQGGGTSVGVSFALDEHDIGALTTISGTDAAQVLLDVDTINATATVDADRTASAQTSALAAPDAEAGASVAVSVGLITAGTTGEIRLDHADVNAANGGQIAALGGGQVVARAIQQQGGAGSQPRVGGVSALITGSRDLMLNADRGYVQVAGGMMELGARDSGVTRADSLALSSGQGTGVSVNAALVLARGSVSSTIGGEVARGDNPVMALIAGQGATLSTIAADGRDFEARNGAIGLNLGGAQVGVGSAAVISSREIAARSRDIVIVGDGTIALDALRTGLDRAQAALGGVNGSGVAVNVNGATTIAGGSIIAAADGTRSFVFDGVLDVAARDSGTVETRMLDVAVSSSNAIGAQVLSTILTRDVTARIGDSATQGSALTGGTRVSAHAAADLGAIAASANVAASVGVNATYRMLTTDRETSATLGGMLTGTNAAVSAVRADDLDATTVDVAVSGGTSVGAKFTLLQQGGGTTALFSPDAGSSLTGAASVTALDETSVTANSFALAVASGVSAFGEGLVLVLGGQGGTPDPVRTGDMARAEEAEVDALQAAAEGAGDRALDAATVDTDPQPDAAPLSAGLVLAQVQVQGAGDIALGSLSVNATADTDAVLRLGAAGVSGGTAAGGVAGIGIARTRALARIDSSALGGVLDVAGAVTVNARNTGALDVTAIGVGVGGGVGATGGFAMALDRRRTEIELTGGSIVAASMQATAQTGGDVTARGLILSAGGTAGVGVGVALALDDRETLATIDGTDITTTGGSLAVESFGGGDTLALATAAGVGGTAGVASSVAIARQAGTVRTVADGADLSATGDIRLGAVQAQDSRIAGSSRPSVTAISVPVGAGGTAGVAAGIAIALKDGVTEALVQGGTVQAGDDVELRARADAQINAVGVGIAAGGTAGVTGSVSVLQRDDTTRASIQGGQVTAQDAVVVEALAETAAGASGGQMAEAGTLDADLSNVQIGVAAGGTAGVGVSVSVPVLRNRVEALIGAGANVTAHGVAGLGTQVRLRDIDLADVEEELDALSRVTRRGVSVVADSAVSHGSVAATVAVGGQAGVAAQVGVTSVEDTVIARIGDETGPRTRVMSGDDITVQAAGTLALRNIAIAGGGGGAAGVGAASSTIVTAREITAEVLRGDLIAEGQVAVLARGADRITSTDVAAGLGAYAGVAGAVTVVSGESTVLARLDRAGLYADDIDVEARLDRDISLQTAGIGGAIGAAVGSVLVLDAVDRAQVVIVDGTAADHTVLQAEQVSLNAHLGLGAQLEVGTVLAALGGAHGAVVTGFVDTVSRVDVGDHSRIGTSAQQVGAVDILAYQDIGPRDAAKGMVRGGALSLTGGSVGGTVAILSSNAVTQVDLGDDAQIHARDTVSLRALTERDLGTSAHALAVGIGGTINYITARTLIGGGADGDDLDDAADAGQALSGDDGLAQGGTDYLRAGQTGTEEAAEIAARRDAVGRKLTGLGAAGADRTVAQVGTDAQIVAQGGIVVAAQDSTTTTTVAGGLGIAGGLAATAGHAVTDVNTDVVAEIARGALLRSGGDVQVAAGTSGGGSTVTGYAGAVGLNAAVGLAVADLVQSRDATLIISDDVVVEGARIALDAQGANAADVRVSGSAIAGTAAATGMQAGIEDRSAASVQVGAASLTAQDLSISGAISAAQQVRVASNAIALGAAGALLNAELLDRSAVGVVLNGTQVDAAQTDIRGAISGNRTAYASGISGAAAIAGGITRADVDVARVVDVRSDAQVVVDGGDLGLSAANSGDVAATALAGSGALGVAGAGSIAVARDASRVDATLGGVLDLRGMAGVSAQQSGAIVADADSTAIGGFGSGGAAQAQAVAAGQVATWLDASGQAAIARAQAETDQDVDATAQGDGGGVLAVSLTGAAVDATSATQVQLSSGGDVLVAGTLQAGTDHAVRYSALADTALISAIGRAAASSDADVATQSGVTVLGGAQIAAGTIDLDVITALTRSTTSTPDARGGSGGGVGATGIEAEADLALDGYIRMANGALLEQTSRSGALDINVASTARAGTATQISTVEGASLPVARSRTGISNDALFEMDSGSTLSAAGDMAVSVGTQGGAVADASVYTLAAGSRITVSAQSDYDARDRIILAGGSAILGEQDIVLGTGRSTAGLRDAQVISRAGYRSDSFVPLDRAPVAISRGDMTSTIVTGGVIEAGGAVALNTERGTVAIGASALGKNLWTESAEGIVNFLGDFIGADEVDLDIVGTQTRALTENTGVTVPVGAVIRSGLAADIGIYVNANGDFTDGPNGPVITDTDAIPAYVLRLRVALLRDVVLAPLHRQRAAFEAEGNTGAVALMDLQIAEVTGQFEVLAADLPGNFVNLLMVGDLQVDGADISINGGYLTGGGTLAASTDAGVRIDVDEDNMAVFLNDIIIPDRPGAVLLDGVTVRSNAGVDALNSFDAAEARGRITTSGLSSFGSSSAGLATPDLVFEAAGAGSGGIDVDAQGSIFAFGDLVNRSGVVALNATKGNILLQGNLIADSAQISAAQGNVLVGFVDGLRNAGGDPAAQLRGELEAIEAARGGGLTALVSPDDLGQDAPGIIANNVSIYGTWVNVNARIEAGQPEVTLDIASYTDSYIDNILVNRMGGTGRALLHDPLDDTAPYTGITGNLAVWYDADADRLEIERAVASGGQVRIAGQIISTGGGQISVLDGYSDISINSHSDKTLRLGQIDTGGADGVRGRIELIDTRYIVNANATDALSRYRVTTFEGTGGDNPAFPLERDILVTQNGVESVIQGYGGPRSTQYQIDAQGGLVPYIRYEVETTRHPNNPADLATRVVGDAQVVDQSAGLFYRYNRRDDAGIGTGGEVHSHSFRADTPIDIELRGERYGSINISNGGDVELAGLVRSEGAGIAVSSTHGSVTGVTADALIRGRNIDLSGDGIGGGGLQALQIHQSSLDQYDSLFPSLSLSADAGAGDVRLESRATGLVLGTVSGDVVELRANGSIINDQVSNVVTPDVRSQNGLTLISREGGLGNLVADLHIVTGDGVLNASARDDVRIDHARGTDGDQTRLLIGRVESLTGDVWMRTTGTMVDANENDVTDIFAQEAALKAFWQQIGLIDENGNTNAQRVAAEIEAEKARQVQALAFYLEVSAVQGVAYDAGFDGALSMAEQQSLTDAGFTPDMLVAEQARRVALYSDGYAIRQANPGAQPGSYSPVLDAAAVARIEETFGLDFARDLDVGLRRDFVVAASDTQIAVEQANIAAAGGVRLWAQQVGEDSVLGTVITDGSSDTIGLGTIWDLRGDAEIPRSLLIALATAERDDIERIGAPINKIRIRGQQDLDIDAGLNPDASVSGGVYIEAARDDGGDTLAFVGSEGDMLVERISATGSTRVKVGGDVIGRLRSGGTSGSAATHLRGANVVIEAAGGSIGSLDQQIELAGPDNAPIILDARATGDVHIGRRAAGDLQIASLRADTGVARIVAAGGDLTAAQNAGDGTLRAAQVTLSASGDIGGGLRIAASDSSARTRIDAGGAIDLTVEGDMTAGRITAGNDLRLTIADGSLTLSGDTGSDGRQVAAAISTPGDVTFIAQNGAILDGGNDGRYGGNTLATQVVADVQGAQLNIFTAGFGAADNAIETRVNDIWGQADGIGANILNTSDLDISGLSGGADADVVIAADGSRITLDLVAQTRARNLTYDAYDVVVQRMPTHSGNLSVLAGNLLSMPATLDLRATGDLTLAAWTLNVADATAPLRLNAAADGRIIGGGTVSLDIGNSIAAREIRGRDVILNAGRQVDNGMGFGVDQAATAQVQRVIAGNDAMLRSTSTGTYTLVQAGGLASVETRSNVDGAVLDLSNLRAHEARIVTTALVQDRLDVDAAVLGGTLGSTRAGQVLVLGARATELRGLRTGSAFDRLQIDAYDTQLRITDSASSESGGGALSVNANSITVDGTLSGADLVLHGINGVTVGGTGRIEGWSVDIAAGGPLGGDFAARPADITVADGGAIIGTAPNSGLIRLHATDHIRATGIESRRDGAGDAIILRGISVSGGMDGGLDLTANGQGALTTIEVKEIQSRAGAPLRTQVNRLDIRAERGTIAVLESDTLILEQAATDLGDVDIVAGGDLALRGNGQVQPTVASGAGGHVILTALGSLWSDTTNGPVTIATEELHLRALTGSMGTLAQSLDLDLLTHTGYLTMAAQRHIAARIGGRIGEIGLLASQSGDVSLRTDRQVRVDAFGGAGVIDLNGPDLSSAMRRGQVDTVPVNDPVVAEPIYPVWVLSTEGAQDQNGVEIYDPNGQDLTFTDYIPPDTGGGDGEGGEGGEGGETPDPIDAETRDRIDAFLAQLQRKGGSLRDIFSPGPLTFQTETDEEQRQRREEQQQKDDAENGDGETPSRNTSILLNFRPRG